MATKTTATKGLETYKLECKDCGKSYRTDKKRGKRITKLLEAQPDYLESYQCRDCKENTRIHKIADKVADQIKEEDSVKKVKREPVQKVREDLSVNDFIPTETENYINRKFGGVTDHKILNYHLTTKNKITKNVIFIGETGTGKTACVQNFAYKNKLPYYRAVMNAGTTTEDIVGQFVMNKEGKLSFSYQVLVKFMQEGGVFVFDEINAGQKEILHILNQITDYARQLSVTQHKGEVIKAVDNFLVVACMNPPQEYDLQELSKSLKSRFVPYIFDYDEKIDAKILGKDEKKLLSFSKSIRQARENQQIETPLSTRDLLQFKAIRDDLGFKLAKQILIGKFHNGEKAVVKTMIETFLEKSTILKEEEEDGAPFEN